MKITLNNSLLDSYDMIGPSIKHSTPYQSYFILDSGQEHYRLLRYLASQIKTDVIEIGTHAGTSAIAMSLDTKHTVLTYDIVEEKQRDYSELENIVFRLTDYQSDTEYHSFYDRSNMIFIDAPHDGAFERNCFDWIKQTNFKGISVWDDIHLNPDMEFFWADIDLPKLDVTKYGHVTGTGIVFHSTTIEFDLQ
jgi:predicted O-methyltransferase YrrM